MGEKRQAKQKKWLAVLKWIAIGATIFASGWCAEERYEERAGEKRYFTEAALYAQTSQGYPQGATTRRALQRGNLSCANKKNLV